MLVQMPVLIRRRPIAMGGTMAWAGLIAVCPWKGNSYSASTIFAAVAKAASGLPVTLGFGVDVGVAPRMYV